MSVTSDDLASDDLVLDDLAIAQTNYKAAKVAFERGDYRKSVNLLEDAAARVNPNSSLGGEVQIWLVTAYEAAGLRQAALDLCKQLTDHPNLKTRKQGRRLLYIMEAPKLQTRPEWVTQIPDLAALTDGESRSRLNTPGGRVSRRSPAAKPQNPFEPVDLSNVNTEDNRFVWVALGAALVILVSLFWLG